MKFENKYIKIKTKKREVTLHNYIYDRYLATFSKSQYETDADKLASLNSNKSLSLCYIKFETELNDITNAERNDFDISLDATAIDTTGNSNSVNTFYTYSTKSNRVFDIKLKEFKTSDDYKNKKITALGFGNQYIMSCVDTSNYDIAITEGETFIITRKDIMTTDGECEGIDYPLHIAPESNIYETIESEMIKVPVWARLYSIGFGRIKGNIEEEYLIGKDIQVIKESETVFGFNLLKEFQENMYPKQELYAGDELYPLPFNSYQEEYPLKDLYCGDDFFPLQSNYKYIIYKFRLCYYDNMQARIINLDKYYTLNYLETKAKGIFKIKTKIERKM